jgi:FtsZ-interacting cell division protein ZipA
MEDFFMRKNIGVVLAVIMSIAMLCACSNSNDFQKSVTDNSTQITEMTTALQDDEIDEALKIKETQDALTTTTTTAPANNITTTTATSTSKTAVAKIKAPKKTSIKKVKGAKKAISVTWKKVSGVKGYQVQVATNKKFKKNKKTVTVKKQKTTKTTVKKLKAKKKYYVRVRTYKIVNGKKVYSSWSKVKSVKTK